MRVALGARINDGVARREASIPDGLRVYAVGDIHGRADLLGRMAEVIDDELRTRPAHEIRTVFLGDYIDRGPASADVIDRLARADFPTPLITLTGNHEDIFLKFLRGSVPLEHFLGNGGDATLQSYGLVPQAMLGLKPKDVGTAVLNALPASHLAFLEARRLSASFGDYFFCHAGARPGIALDRQSDDDLLWIREQFLRSSFDFGKIIIHGHTPVRTPEIRVNGIDIDTKAFASGVLTAIVLEGTERRFITARM